MTIGICVVITFWPIVYTSFMITVEAFQKWPVTLYIAAWTSPRI